MRRVVSILVAGIFISAMSGQSTLAQEVAPSSISAVEIRKDKIPIQFLLLFPVQSLADIYTYRNLQEIAQPALNFEALSAA